MTTLQSYCKVEENIPLLGFGNSRKKFNHILGEGVGRVELRRQLTDSVEIRVDVGVGVIDEFKLTNQSVITWDDYWVDKETNLITDPNIVHKNLQRNSLVYVNMSTPRPRLETLNLEGNTSLTHLYIHETPNLRHLDLSGCTSLKFISLGLNGNIQTLLANNCNLSSTAMEQLLRDFRPTITANANEKGVGMFRKQYNTLLDLRGNVIDWNNKRISSKIRLLLANNWVVKWDNNPPPEVVPIRLYRFFVESQLGK
jgi:hypothetical protein